MVLGLAACGGGGGGSSNSPSGDPQFAQQCAPSNPLAPASSRTGSLITEKQWVRSYFNDNYLWYDEVPNVNANASPYSNANDVYGSLSNYFRALKTPAKTPSGAFKDKFSFISTTEAWNQLSNSGVEAGYGIAWTAEPTDKTRGLRIAYIEPGSQAATAGLKRGDVLRSIDGVSVDIPRTDSKFAVLSEGVSPSQLNANHTFIFGRTGVADFSTSLTTSNITKQPVLTRSVVTAADGAKVGYVVFNDHIATAESQLIEAINYLKSQNVTDLVLDIRYNGGGYLYIASELAYMIAGSSSDGKVFEKLTYNAKRATETNSSDSATPFFSQSCILNSSFQCTDQKALPSLNLKRVYVLTQSDTCSASEAIINGLRGVDVDVHQIGKTTCGKPYGFTAKDNCGISYFPIEFKGANAKGFGDYPDGFIPGGDVGIPTALPGCVVADDLNKDLGDTTEGMLAAALNYRNTGACPTVTASRIEKAQGLPLASALSSLTLKNPLRENRILLPNR